MFTGVTKDNVRVYPTFTWEEGTTHDDKFSSLISGRIRCDAHVYCRFDGSSLSFPVTVTPDQQERFAVLIDELRRAAAAQLETMA